MDSRDDNWLGALWKDATVRAPFELVSPLKREEVERRLKEAIDSEWTLFGQKPVVGGVDGHSFRLRRRIFFRNSFQTVIDGTLDEQGGKTRLHCRSGPRSFIALFLAACLVAVAAVGTTLSWLVMAHSEEVAGQLPLITGVGTAVPFVMLAFGIALFWFGRWLARGEREELIEFLERTIQAKVVG